MELVLIIGGIIIYFLPSIIGYNSKNASGIIILNLFLGWTFLGWVAALIWAVSAPKLNKSEYYSPQKENKAIGKSPSLLEKLFSIQKTNRSNTADTHPDPKINELLQDLQEGEAIIKNKLTENYEIIEAETWDRIIIENKQDDYEIVYDK